jgi:sodium-dependent dicarboxylate transporter 2/3/5
MLIGAALFLVIYLSPPWGDAVDPSGQHFQLTREGKASLALFGLAAVWWVFEVIPIGVTGITIGVIQALFLIRSPKVALSDFMDPSVWFIIGSLVIGKAFTKTGLTQRMAYRMLSLVGERTSMITLGTFVMTALLTLVMAHTAVAATIFPLLMAIHSLYDDTGKATKFGRGLFIGMAYVCGAGSIVSLLGSARAPVAIGFFKNMAGREISFFELIYYMLPLGWVMIFTIWIIVMLAFKPERKVIPGLKEKVSALSAKMGGISGKEKGTLAIVFLAILVMGMRSFIPALDPLDKSAIILVSTILFFLFNIIDIKPVLPESDER